MTALYLVLALVALFGITIWATKRWGRAEAREDLATTALMQAQESHAIDETVSRLDDRALDQRLRDAGN